MPRFRLRTAFCCLGLVAIWLASFHMGTLGFDIRRGMWFLSLLIPVLCVVPLRNAAHAFWSGFAITLVCTAARTAFGYADSTGTLGILASLYFPSFGYSYDLAKFVAGNTDSITCSTIHESLAFGSTLTFCVLIGFLSAAIYRARKRSGGD